MKTHKDFLIYKPYRMVSQFTSNDRHQRNKRFLGELHNFPDGSMAVGRLDENTEGLLLITTDGKWSYEVNTSIDYDKEYYAQVDGNITEDAINTLRGGVSITVNGVDYITKPAIVEKIQIPDLPETKQRIRDDRHGPTSWISVTITEGKFRQVRKMFGAVNFPVLRLARVRIGTFTLDTLKGKNVMEIER